MKFKIERTRLYEACRKVSKAASASKSSQIPELAGILMQADADKRILRLTCTDLSVSMQMKLKDVDVTESGEIVILNEMFTSMLGAMEGDEVGITVSNNTLQFQCGRTFVHTSTLPAEKYPAVKFSLPENTVQVSGLALLAKKTAAVANMGNNQTNYQGVQIRFTSETSTATAADGIRFLKSQGVNIADGELDLFIPERALNLLFGIVKIKDELYVGTVNNKAVFITDEYVFTTSLLNGDLSSVENIIQKFTAIYSATVKVKELAESLELCGTLLFGADQCVNITVNSRCLKISVENENGSISNDITVKNAVSMDGKVFHYNPKYLNDFIRSSTGELELSFTEKGFLMMKCGSNECVVSARSAAKIKPIPVKTVKTEKPDSKNKTTKGKTAKKSKTAAA
jgi:DNA polymerase III sliding clamp (beta) subunit (PCNA family)